MISSSDGDVIGDVAQSLLEYLGLSVRTLQYTLSHLLLSLHYLLTIVVVYVLQDLNSISDCPREVEQFSSLLNKVNECHAARQRLAVGLADSSATVKALVVRAEDTRSRAEMYVQPADMNKIFL